MARRRRLQNHTKRELRMLSTPLTDEEVLVYAERAAGLQEQLGDKLDALRAAQKAAKAEIEEIERERNALLYKVSARREDREAEVEIVYKWRANRVITTRTDTGQIVEDRVMTHDERQTTIFDLEAEGVLDPVEVAASEEPIPGEGDGVETAT